VHQELSEKNIRVVTPRGDEVSKYNAELEKKDFTYDEKRDCFPCPMGKDLPLRRLQRSENNVTREYRADRKDCKECPCLSTCLQASRAADMGGFFHGWGLRPEQKNITEVH